MNVTHDEFHALMLADYQRQWSEEDFLALSDAVLYCYLNGVPIQEWMAEALVEELDAAFRNLGPRERGLGRGRQDRLARRAIRKQRAGWAEFYLKGGLEADRMKRADAFEAASRALRGKPAQGSPEQIEKAHNAERRLERLREKRENR